jgi:molybdenum cofactor biosynthesis enzyme MoaA
MDLLCELFPTARYKMNTSGVSLLRRSKRLLQYPIKNITVSLNATTEQTYAAFIGKGLTVVLDGIAALVEERVAAGREDLRLCLSMVVMRSTLPELSQMARLAYQLGVEEIQGIMLMLHDSSLEHESPYHIPAESNRAVAVAVETATRLGSEPACRRVSGDGGANTPTRGPPCRRRTGIGAPRSSPPSTCDPTVR